MVAKFAGRKSRGQPGAAGSGHSVVRRVDLARYRRFVLQGEEGIGRAEITSQTPCFAKNGSSGRSIIDGRRRAAVGFALANDAGRSICGGVRVGDSRLNRK